MELILLYAFKIRKFNNNEFVFDKYINFSYRYTIKKEFNRTNNIFKVNIKLRTGFVDFKIYKNNSDKIIAEVNNIYAFIGKNGAGKSTMFKFLLELLTLKDYDNYINGEFLLIFKDQKKFYYFTNKENIVLDFSYRNQKKDIERLTSKDLSSKINVIFYSPLVTNSFNIAERFKNVIDISTDHYLLIERETFKSRNLLRQLKFLEDEEIVEIIKKLLNINIPEDFTFLVKIRYPNLNKVNPLIINIKQIFDELIKITKDKNKALLITFSYFSINYFITEKNEEVLKEFNIRLTNIIKNDNIEQLILDLELLLKNTIKSDYYEQIVNLIKKSSKAYYSKNGILNIKLSINDPKVLNIIKDLFKLVKDETREFFAFDWGLSSGEKALLDLFSRFYYIKDKVTTNDIYIFLDEAETSLHPEWQRKFIFLLINFFYKIFPGKTIQIFIASHSPLLISDLPKYNITFINKFLKFVPYDNVSQTFAANLSSILANGFFLSESLIGEFAKRKIDYALFKISELEKIQFKIDEKEFNKKFKRKIWPTIKIVGDDLIRNLLKHRYKFAKYGKIKKNKK